MIKAIAFAAALLLPATAHAYTEEWCAQNGTCIDLNSIHCDSTYCIFDARIGDPIGHVAVDCVAKVNQVCLSNGVCSGIRPFVDTSISAAVCNGFSK